MAVEPHVRTWEEHFAARTRAGGGDGLLQILALAGAKDVISFAGGFPDPATFPGPVIAEILAELAEQGDASPFQYAPTEGLAGPRDLVADRLERLEGLRPGAGELMLTSGAIEALELVGKAFVDSGDRVLVEAPTYLGAIMAFQGFEAQVDATGRGRPGRRRARAHARLGAGAEAPVHDPRLPEPGRRVAVHRAAPRAGRARPQPRPARDRGRRLPRAVLRRERPPSLWSLAPDVVVQAGTFSKTFFPGVRLGWAAGPADIVAKLVWAKQNTDQCAGAMGQRLLEEYARRGHLDRQIEQARGLYKGRRDALLAALDRHVGERATWTRPQGGFFAWLELAEGADAVAVAGQALEAGVAVVPGPPFFPAGGGERHVRLSYSRVTEDEIEAGIERLASLL